MWKCPEKIIIMNCTVMRAEHRGCEESFVDCCSSSVAFGLVKFGLNSSHFADYVGAKGEELISSLCLR